MSALNESNNTGQLVASLTSWGPKALRRNISEIPTRGSASFCNSCGQIARRACAMPLIATGGAG